MSSSMCFDPTHRPPPPPPAKAVLADLSLRLSSLETAWNAFRDSQHRPQDWIQAEREIGRAARDMVHDCERTRRFLGDE